MAKKSSDKSENNSYGLASVILGILSIVFALSVLFGSIAGLILGIIGLFFSIKQNKISKNKWSSAGMILSILGIALNIFVLIWLLTTFVSIVKQFQDLQASGQLNNLAQQYAP